MSNELEPSLGELADHPLISKWEIRSPFYPGDQINRLRVTFTNGRAASIIYGGMLMMPEGMYEIAAINADGELDYTTDVIGPDVLKGDARDVVRWILALANLPADGEGTTPEPGKELAVRYWEPCVVCVEAERVHPTPETWDSWQRIRLAPEAVIAMAEAAENLGRALKEVMDIYNKAQSKIRSQINDWTNPARGVDVAGAWIDEIHDWAYPHWDVPRPTKTSYTANFILNREEADQLCALMGIDQLPDSVLTYEPIPEPHQPGKPVRYWGRAELLARVRGHWTRKD